MSMIKKRWIILIVSCLVNLCIGSLYSWSVFSGPMGEYLNSMTNQKITSLSIVFTIANSLGPITMISGGMINDRIGPRWVLIAGAVLFGGGMIGASFARSVFGLILTYSLGVGLGMGMVYGTTVSNTIKFFPDRKGLVGGLTTACYGGSSILIPPIANLLIQNFHVTTAFRMVGIVSFGLIGFSSFILQPCPEDLFRHLKGSDKKEWGNQRKERDYRQMLKDPVFPVMLLILMCGAFSGLMFISQVSPIAQVMMGFSMSDAALSVSVLALFNTLGRVGAGILSDKLGLMNTLKGTFLLSIAASILLYLSQQGTMMIFYMGLAMMGSCFGAVMGVFPSFTASQFGTRNNSVNYGIMFIGFALAGVLGPSIMSKIFQQFGRYQPAFLVSLLLSALGFLLTNVFVVMNKRSELLTDKQK